MEPGKKVVSIPHGSTLSHTKPTVVSSPSARRKKEGISQKETTVL